MFGLKEIISGNLILGILDILIVVIFFTEVYLYKKYPCKVNCPDSAPTKIKKWVRMVKIYQKNGLLLTDLLILVLMMIGSSFSNEAFSARFIALFATLIGVFVIAFVSKKILFQSQSFESHAVNHEIDAVYHLIAAQVFILAVPIIKLPSLFLMLAGLSLALILCFLIVIRTIIDPRVLIHRSKTIVREDAFQLIKGMLVIVVCIWLILYLMVYACWRTNPDFYLSVNGNIAPLDLLYYMFVSFSTIGFGDIVAVRADGMFFSRAVAIIISISGFFTAGCFISAVVSGVSDLKNGTKNG